MGVDAGTDLARKAVLSPAGVYESKMAEELVSREEREVFGDRAYESKSKRQWLRSLEIDDRIMRRSHKHQWELQH